MGKPDADDRQPVVPGYYFNGFQLGLSNADISLVLLLNNLPAASLNMSYTTAKTLSVALEDMITTLEDVTQRKIMTNKDVSEGLSKLPDNETETDVDAR